MKIFNEENGVKVVYVQMNDIGALTHYENEIPASIFTQVFKGITIIDDSNRWEFERFTDPFAIEFFKKTDWIVDYKFYRDMSEKDLIDHGQAIADEMKAIAKEFNKYPEEERQNHLDLRERYDLLEFKFNSLPYILWLKQGHITMPIPEVPDVDGFTLTNNDESFPYVVQQGLNPLQMLLFRKDGKPLKKIEKISIGFLQTADSLLITNNLEKNEFFGSFEKCAKRSDDGKYFITTFKMMTIKNNQEKSPLSSRKEQMTLGKRIKNTWGKIVNHIKG